MKEKIKVWAGIVLMVLGAIGITDKLGVENVSNLIDGLLVVIGAILDIVSTHQSQKTIATLKK